MSKVISIDALTQLRPELQAVVLIGGVFDVLHAGHIDHIDEAKSLGKTLVVHITSDKRVRQKKGEGRPFFPESERAKVVAALRSVDYVFVGDAPHYDRQVLAAVKPDTLFLNQEAATQDVRDYIRANAGSKVIISNAPKINNSSNIVTQLLKI